MGSVDVAQPLDLSTPKVRRNWTPPPFITTKYENAYSSEQQPQDKPLDLSMHMFRRCASKDSVNSNSFIQSNNMININCGGNKALINVFKKYAPSIGTRKNPISMIREKNFVGKM